MFCPYICSILTHSQPTGPKSDRRAGQPERLFLSEYVENGADYEFRVYRDTAGEAEETPAREKLQHNVLAILTDIIEFKEKIKASNI